MASIEVLATFLGWCTVFNASVLLLFVLVTGFAHDTVGKLNAKLFGVTPEDAKVTIFRVFMQYRVAFVVLNLVPYIALKIMA